MIEYFAAGLLVDLEHFFHDAFEERDVAIDSHGEEAGRRFSVPAPSMSRGVLRMLEAHHAAFRAAD